MNILKIILVLLLVSCDPPPMQDSILNYKGGVVISRYSDMGARYHFKIRMYNKTTHKYEIKSIIVYDGVQFTEGMTIQ